MAKTAIITGCSSGIGLAAAKIFQSKGWNVVATMRQPESDAGLELSKLSNTLVLKLDVQDNQNIKDAVDATIAKFGKIDLLINNAGYGQVGVLEATSREKIIQQFDVNVFGVIETIKAVLPHMRNNEPIDGSRGTILNVGSGGGIFPLPLLSLYCASKHALDGLTEAISYELASQQISTKFVIPHTGVESTNFQQNSAASFAVDAALSSYDNFTSTVLSQFGKMGAGTTLTSAQVAQCIYEAATDSDLNRLRYYIGHDPKEILKKRQEYSEEDFMKYIRSSFALSGARIPESSPLGDQGKLWI